VYGQWFEFGEAHRISFFKRKAVQVWVDGFLLLDKRNSNRQTFANPLRWEIEIRSLTAALAFGVSKLLSLVKILFPCYTKVKVSRLLAKCHEWQPPFPAQHDRSRTPANPCLVGGFNNDNKLLRFDVLTIRSSLQERHKRRTHIPAHCNRSGRRLNLHANLQLDGSLSRTRRGHPLPTPVCNCSPQCHL
jgi:hypothetical protein